MMPEVTVESNVDLFIYNPLCLVCRLHLKGLKKEREKKNHKQTSPPSHSSYHIKRDPISTESVACKLFFFLF